MIFSWDDFVYNSRGEVAYGCRRVNRGVRQTERQDRQTGLEFGQKRSQINLGNITLLMLGTGNIYIYIYNIYIVGEVL